MWLLILVYELRTVLDQHALLKVNVEYLVSTFSHVVTKLIQSTIRRSLSILYTLATTDLYPKTNWRIFFISIKFIEY